MILKIIKWPHLTFKKEIANATAIETLDAILKDLGESSFAILVDESRDISIKEQLAIVLRYLLSVKEQLAIDRTWHSKKK
jgi:hypothetical protein